LLDRARALPRHAAERYMSFGPRTKVAIWLFGALNIVAIVFIIIVTPHQIGVWFNNLAISLRRMGPWGVLLEGLLVVLVSHPPFGGFAASMTLIGFTYGMWPGCLIAVVASMTGAGFAFLSVRAFFLSWVKKQSNAKWDAFGNVMRAKGLPLIIMIRYCPIPWAICNGLFASIESVKFWQFMLANLVMQPRLLIPVFIGSRLTSLASETPTHDPLRFWLNLASVGVSLTVSTLGGIWIYRLTLEQMRKLDKSGPGQGELAAEALEEGGLLGDYEDDEADDEPLTDRAEATRGRSGPDQ